METVTCAAIGSRTFKTMRGAHSEAMRSLDYAASADCTVDVVEYEDGFAVAYISDQPADKASFWQSNAQVWDVWAASPVQVAAPVAEYVETFECPKCQGGGEIGTTQDYFGNWDSETCRYCGGSGVVSSLEPRDEDEA